MKCQNCNRTVTRKAKFCPTCGEKIIHRTSAKQANNSQGTPFVYGIGFLALGILIGFVVFKFSSNTGNQSTSMATNFQNPPVIQTAEVLGIAKEFMCFCGNCSDPLHTCQCDHPEGAVEVKNFIAQKLQEGHQKSHIVELVQSQYGPSNMLLDEKIVE